jgi:hypothetical protein
LKNDVNVVMNLQKSQKIIFLASWRSLTRIAGSGSGNASLWYGSANPDLDQNGRDLEHCQTE